MDSRIRTVIGRVFDIDKARIDDNLSLEELWNWDSLQQINLVIALEEEFTLRFSAEEASEMTTYQAIREAVFRRAGHSQ